MPDMQKVRSVLERAGEKKFRETQIKEAIFVQLVSSWNEITTLSDTLRNTLTKEVPFSSLELINETISATKDTEKLAFRLSDGNIIETVLMRHDATSRDADGNLMYGRTDGRRTVCVSSQAGCPMRCAFCATGTMGLKRNLTANEIVDQVLFFARRLKVRGERVSNIVLMGMGEPMHNYDAVMEAIRAWNDQKGLAIGARHISISTCGIVPGINRLADETLQVNLAISLHAPNDKLRTRLMPVNNAYPLAKLMPAIDAYIAKTNRKVMFEYLLIDDLNDTPEIAHELADLMDKPLYHVNLIKYHTTGAFISSPKESRLHFLDILKKRGISATHRVTFGEDIDAACGQLANKQVKNKTVSFD